MSKVKLTTLYVKDNDGQESSVNMSESQTGLSASDCGLIVILLVSSNHLNAIISEIRSHVKGV